ncbi:MAG: hypothetical protein NUV63_00790 [Gallionella sp.]|nr:hypothetical protein [Gallionella sp.]
MVSALWCFCHSATAQPFATGEAIYSKDSDGFQVNSLTAGFGLYVSKEKFFERLGFKQSSLDFAAPGFSMHGNGTGIYGAKILPLPSVPVKGEVELTRLALPGWSANTGAMQISGQAMQAMNYEIRAEKNIVDSVMGLTNRVTYSAQTVAVDYPFTPRINVAGVLGRQSFSDQNMRTLIKGKASYVLSEDYGLRTYLKLTRHTNSLPYTGNYFSPDDFQDYHLGFGFRRRLAMLYGVLSAYAEAGSQAVDGADSPVHGAQIRLEAFLGRPWYYDLAAGVQTSAGTGGGSDYEYRYARASFVWPF